MNPVLFFLIILLIVGGGYIANSKLEQAQTQQPQNPPPTQPQSSQTPQNQPTQYPMRTQGPTQAPAQAPTQAPTLPPIITICGSGTPVYDQNGNFVRCDCPLGTAGSRCQFTRSTHCNGGGNPRVDTNDKFISCQCDPGRQGTFCCDTNSPVYGQRNTCSDVATCTQKGWNITQKKCSEINLKDPACTSLCKPGVSISNLRCNSYSDDYGVENNNAVVSCNVNSDYLISNNPDSDPFLEALYYPPNELKPLNKRFWETLKTDRDLKEGGVVPTNDSDKQAERVFGNYGAFFKVYDFPDDNGGDNKVITNRDLTAAINDAFDNKPRFGFDNFGNIAIEVNGITKIFHNPAFPYKQNKLAVTAQGTPITDKTLCENTLGTWDGNTCWQYLNKGTKFNSFDLRLNNKNFITSTNKKWILYNNYPDPAYRLLYNPIHGTNFKKYFSSLASSTTPRREDRLLQKYSEMAAEKGTYGITHRRYGDDSAHCFGSAKNKSIKFPDCIGYNSSSYNAKKYFINPENPTEAMISLDKELGGACACYGPSCKIEEQMLHGKNADKSVDTFLSDFQKDMMTKVYNDSVNNNGICPTNKNISICDVTTASAGSIKTQNLQINLYCGK